MAAGVLPAPGTELGPCADTCRHIDCEATRRQTAIICALCGEPIGYDRRFYDTRADATIASDLAHAECVEVLHG